MKKLNAWILYSWKLNIANKNNADAARDIGETIEKKKLEKSVRANFEVLIQ